MVFFIKNNFLKKKVWRILHLSFIISLIILIIKTSMTGYVMKTLYYYLITKSYNKNPQKVTMELRKKSQHATIKTQKDRWYYV